MGTTTLHQQGTTNDPPYSAGINEIQNTQSFTGTGVFFSATSYGINSIVDGTSNTIAFSESLVGNDQSNAYRANSISAVATGDPSGVLTNSSTNVPTVNVAALACAQSLQTQGATNSGTVFGSTRSQWITGTMSDNLFNSIIPANSTQCKFGGCKFRGSGVLEGVNITNVQTNHPGGANSLFADGSVKFLKSTINQLT